MFLQQPGMDKPNTGPFSFKRPVYVYLTRLEVEDQAKGIQLFGFSSAV